MTNGLTRPLQNQTQNLPRSQSTTPSTARKNAPSPTPQFDARKLRNGMTLNFEFSCQKYYRNTCNMSHSVPFCKMLKSNLNQNESNLSQSQKKSDFENFDSCLKIRLLRLNMYV